MDQEQRGKPPYTLVIHAHSGAIRMRYTYDLPPRCVVCGFFLTYSDLVQCGHWQLAPCCQTDQMAVMAELMLDGDMWPHDWHGHWAKTNDGDGWVQI